MKSSMKMIAEASMTLAGQEAVADTDPVTYNPQKHMKDKMQTKISFHLSQEENEEEDGVREEGEVDSEAAYQDDILQETECSFPLIYDHTDTKQGGDDSTPTLTPARVHYTDETPPQGVSVDSNHNWGTTAPQQPAAPALNNGHAVRKLSLTRRDIAVA